MDKIQKSMLSNKKREFGRLKILDSIRGMAALLVLYHHIFKLNKEILKSHTSTLTFDVMDFISELNLEAVLLFFIISGFSIALSIAKRPLTNGNTLNSYLYRRFKRILPIYWLAILLAFITGTVLGILHLNDFSFHNLLGNLLFVQTSASIPESWAVPYGLNGPLWSLAFEMFFYILFPLVYFLNQKWFIKISLHTKYVCLVALVLLGIVVNKKIIFIPYFLFLGGFITWIQGYISAQYYVYWKKRNFFFLANLLIGIAVTIGSSQIPSETVKVIGKGMLLNGLFYFSMIILDQYNTTKIKNFINRLFFKIGEGSYAIYALHYPILIYFQKLGISLKYQLLVIPPFIVCCYLLEKKSLLWKLKFLELDYLKPIYLFNKVVLNKK
ncbi:acyltransferase family protein [Zobellia galactanivorans]|uniref:Acetyltransferase n=1 Tax=Zobellia galactanivorans (strain DSM 12802 / CCUG 47099 / CIP 106680 / NCIMB 13871 / Dsij) TaxID=63186 RepID=G0LAA1_ZOBGA|nr:acyltransferase [Zobellia galactanivorans]CAZ95170.1 Acetyltransferase [Zobellia galactanivorans]